MDAQELRGEIRQILVNRIAKRILSTPADMHAAAAQDEIVRFHIELECEGKQYAKKKNPELKGGLE